MPPAGPRGTSYKSTARTDTANRSGTDRGDLDDGRREEVPKKTCYSRQDPVECSAPTSVDGGLGGRVSGGTGWANAKRRDAFGVKKS